MAIYNIKQLRLARVYKRDLDLIITEAEKAVFNLKKWGHYRSAGRLLVALKDELEIMYGHRKRVETVIALKGEIKVDMPG